jgi:YebC/PmpR family DNA-binding regulatory protein
MAGHSKWANIKHKKAASDAKRAKLFTKIAKELTIAAREGGGDPETNPRLRLMLDKARAANMPNNNIDRAIKRGTGELEGGELFELVYEGYAPHGVGIMIDIVTDNRNRAAADVRHALNKNGGSMADAGSVAWQFTRKGLITIAEEVDEDELFLVAADAGAEDIQFDDPIEVYVPLDAFARVRDTLEESGFSIEEARMVYDPNNLVQLDVPQALQVMRLIEVIEDLDDVQNVYSALDITDEVIAAMDD